MRKYRCAGPWAFLVKNGNTCSAGLQKALNPLCSVQGTPYQAWLNPLLDSVGCWGTVASVASSLAGCHPPSISTRIWSQRQSEFCFWTDIQQRHCVWEYRGALSGDLENKAKHVCAPKHFQEGRYICAGILIHPIIFKVLAALI